jgi:alkylation response protein AidB-like acyl-CoA dehydrogenase
MIDRGDDATVASALAKIAVSEAAVASGLDAIQIHGAIGIVREAGIERDLRDAIPSRIFSGTSEVQRNVIASRLGL